MFRHHYDENDLIVCQKLSIFKIINYHFPLTQITKKIAPFTIVGGGQSQNLISISPSKNYCAN
jgi:hypothetical protein